MNGTSKVHVLVGTPAYGGMVHVEYLRSVMSIGSAGIRYTLMTTSGESLITRARNGIISSFYHRPEFTHLLFLDADIAISGRSVRKLLEHRRDAIGAPVPLKTVPGEPRLFNTGGINEAVGQPVELDRIGTAVLLLSRLAVNALVEDAKITGDVYTAGQTSRGLAGEQQYDVFRVGVVDGEYLSEDYWVCRRLRELGIPIHADLSIRVKHYGNFDFSQLLKDA